MNLKKKLFRPFLNADGPEDFDFPAPALSPIHIDNMSGPVADLSRPGTPNVMNPPFMDESLGVGPQLDVTDAGMDFLIYMD